MRVIAGPGNLANRFEDYDVINNPQGTVITADWANDVQDELMGVQDEAGFTESAGTNELLLKSIIKISKEMRSEIGEFISLDTYKAPVAWDGTSITTAKTYFPAICLSSIDIQTVLNAANYPDLVPHLRSKQLKYLEGKSGEVSSWSCSISGSVVTFPNNASANALLAALAKDVIVHGGYTNWRTLTENNVEYPITNINLTTREVTVTGTPTSGTQSITLFPHRIAGSTTTAREFQVSGKSLISANDSAGLFIPGLRMLGYMQGHIHGSGMATSTNESTFIYGPLTEDLPGLATDIVGASTGSPAKQSKSSLPKTDGTNDTPRTGSETHSPSQVVHLYKFARRYLP